MTNHDKLTVTIGEARLIVHGPAEESPWGKYQFPDMWRGCDGNLYLCVNMGHDCDIGEREESLWFRSSNHGSSWDRIAQKLVDLRPDITELPNGSAISFGRERYVYHWSTYGPGNKWPKLLPRTWGVTPVADPFFREYSMRYDGIFRFGDFPAEARQWPCRIRRPDGDWEETHFSVNAPEIHLCGGIRQQHWWDQEKRWEEVEPRLPLPVPIKVTRLADGSLVSPVAGQHPDVRDRRVAVTYCLASIDNGLTWNIRGTVADQIDLATHGFGGGEQEFVETENGDLLCFMRTMMSAESGVTRFLHVARSSDAGRNWDTPQPLAPVSVTPHATKLENGVLAVIYGRPGVHFALSADEGVSWPTRRTVVGPSEAELLARGHEIKHGVLGDSPESSCANTDLVPTGPDRFVIAYSDFQYPHPDGGLCKAVLTREVVVTK